MLSTEEKQHKYEILELTEVLQAHGIESDAELSKISEENFREIPEVRKLRKKEKS
jgi:hypothetical protein